MIIRQLVFQGKLSSTYGNNNKSNQKPCEKQMTFYKEFLSICSHVIFPGAQEQGPELKFALPAREPCEDQRNWPSFPAQSPVDYWMNELSLFEQQNSNGGPIPP